MRGIIKPKQHLPFSLILSLLVLTVTTSVFAQSATQRINNLQNWVATMNAEAQTLEDIAQIQRVQRAYGYYVDKGFWREAAELFADDATMEVGVDGVYEGKERIRELIIRYGDGNPDTGPGLPFGKMNRHMQLQPVVFINTDGVTAQARWRDFSLLGQYHESAFWGDAVMENTYSKVDGIWKIQSWHLYTNFIAPYEGGWATLEAVSGDWQSDVSRVFPADAPPTVDYKPFPEIYTPAFHYDHPVTGNNQSTWVALTGQGSVGTGEIGDLEEMVMGYARELDNLKAERAIENLQAIYGYYIDKGMWREAADLFTVDGSYEFGQGGVYVGKDRVRQALGLMGPEGLEPGMLNNYPMMQPIITVSEDNLTAKARWRSDVQLSRNGQGYWGGGVYENEYSNDNGVWKISILHYYVTFLADYDKGWLEGTIAMDGPSETLPPDQPPTEVYGSQPEVYLFPFHYPHLVTEEAHIGKGDSDD